MYYKWIKFSMIPVGAILWLLFLKADIELGTGFRIILLHLGTLAIFLTFNLLKKWFLKAFNKNIKIAYFDHETLSLRLDVERDFDATKIERVEFETPKLLGALRLPFMKNRITLHCRGYAIVLKTNFELLELQLFFQNVNRSIVERGIIESHA